MSLNKQLLTDVQDMIIRVATDEGINLQDEFGTKAKFTMFVISFTIKAVMDKYEVSIDEAYDVVMGNGAYRQLADECWGKLQKQA